MIEVIKDLGLASIYLLCGYALRSKVKGLQKLFIPAAVIGGIIGLLLGPEVLGKFSPVCLHFSENVGGYAMPLLAIVFSSMFLGSNLTKDTVKHSGATFFLNCSTMSLQLTLGILLALAFGKMRDLFYGFGMFPFLGFYGGHGVPAITATIFGDAGVFDAELGTSAGNTFATVGMLFGIVVGIIIINIYARKGMIDSSAGIDNLSDEDLSGYLKPENRFAAVTAYTKNDVINPVALHCSIIGLVMCLGYALLPWIQKIPYCNRLNITIPVLIVSVLTNLAANKTGLSKYIDHKSLSNISGVALEYLIVTSVANTKLSIFADYGLEILVMSAVILAADVAFLMFFGKRWHKDHWVENTLGTFGLSTGVLATGFLLIRIADPDNRTGAATNLSCGNGVSTSTVQLFNNYVFPTIVVSSIGFATWYPIISFIIFFVLGNILFGRKKATA